MIVKRKLISHILVLLIISFSQNSLAEISIQTLDSWRIESYSSDNLMVRKPSEKSDSYLAFEMSRPFCICTDPLITTPIANSTYNKGDKIKATMSIDNYKPVDIIFEVVTFLNDTEFLLRPKFYPSLRYANIIKIKFEHNVPLDDILFNTKGMTNAMKQSEKICLSIFELEDSNMQDTAHI